MQLRLLAERGEPEREAGDAERLAAAVRDTAEAQQLSSGLAAAARMLIARGRHEEARGLLLELERTSGARGDAGVATNLPELTRSALAVEDPELARQFVDGVEPLTPVHEHAICSARALLAEAAGDHALAAGVFAEAAERWRTFGNVPERAYALLGQGRSLAAQGQAEAHEPLRAARELFTSIGYKPARAECEALLGEDEAAAV